MTTLISHLFRVFFQLSSVSNKRFWKRRTQLKNHLLHYWYRRLVVPEGLDPVEILIFRILQRASHFPLKSVSPVFRHVCVSLPSKASAGTEIKPQRRRAVKAICHINSKYDARKGHKTPFTHNFLCGNPPSHRRDVCTVASQHETGILRLVALTTRGLDY